VGLWKGSDRITFRIDEHLYGVHRSIVSGNYGFRYLICFLRAKAARPTAFSVSYGVFTRSSKRPTIHMYFEYICWKFTGRLLDRVNTPLAIAILSARLSVSLSVTRVDQSKTVQARITKASPSAGWKTIVSGTVKLFYKFGEVHPEWGR